MFLGVKISLKSLEDLGYTTGTRRLHEGYTKLFNVFKGRVTTRSSENPAPTTGENDDFGENDDLFQILIKY